MRTTIQAVQDVLSRDYDSRNLPTLQPYIDSASALVDRVATCAANKGWTLSDTELELIERWASAHLYTRSDKAFQQKSTQGASGSFQGTTGMYFEASYYGQTALNMDTSGCLTALTKRQVARSIWLGKPKSEQTDYADRD